MLIRKNRGLRKRLHIDTLKLGVFLPSDDMPKEENVNYQTTNIEKPHNNLSEQFH